MSNPWNLNLGKLVVPNIFFESMLIKELAKAYDPQSLTVRIAEGLILVDISHKAIL